MRFTIYDLRFTIAFSDLLILSFPLGGAVVSTRWYRSDISPNEANRACGRSGLPSPSCMARESRRGLRPSRNTWRWRPRHRICQPPSRNQSIPAQRTTTGASSPRHYPLPNYQLPSTHYHLHLSTSTRLRPFPTTARAHPSCDRMRGSLRSGDMSPRTGGRNKCDPPVSILGRRGLRPSRDTWRWRPRHRICQPPSRNQSIPAQRTTTRAPSPRQILKC